MEKYLALHLEIQTEKNFGYIKMTYLRTYISRNRLFLSRKIWQVLRICNETLLQMSW